MGNGTTMRLDQASEVGAGGGVPEGTARAAGDPAMAIARLGERTLLVGTRETIPALAQWIRSGAPGVTIAGCVVIDGGRQGPGPALKGVPVLGGVGAIADAHRVLGFTLAVSCLPRTLAAQGRRAGVVLRELGIPERPVPTVEEALLGAPVAGARAREVEPGELIGRVPHGVDRRSVARVIAGKRVLITGAGGSIGSELARVAASFRPELLVLVERSENALFEIDRQVARRFPDVARKAVLHDVVDEDATMRLAGSLRPHAVFHAAAHKHVPLMEDHPAHAVRNNVLGTKSIADASIACGSERFVLVSSDKAVNPSSVMGATKRLAEMYVQGLSPRAGATRLAMVRFGNVLGSSGSVIPIWAQQLNDGGPLTVTDPRMTRYFMTIPEAAMLVIQASAVEVGPGAAVFVLDMGEPIKILELAKRFATLHGYAPRVESRPGVPPGDRLGPDDTTRPIIDIVFSGIRPGEKLHEELAYSGENLVETDHAGIRAWQRDEPVADGDEIARAMARVRPEADRDEALDAIRQFVPGIAQDLPADAPPDRVVRPYTERPASDSVQAA